MPSIRTEVLKNYLDTCWQCLTYLNSAQGMYLGVYHFLKTISCLWLCWFLGLSEIILLGRSPGYPQIMLIYKTIADNGWYEEKCQVFHNFAFLCPFYAFPCIHPTQDKEAMQVCIRLINKETFLTTRGIFLQERKGRRKYHLINPLICKARRWMHPEENPEWFMGVDLWEENKETHWKKKRALTKNLPPVQEPKCSFVYIYFHQTCKFSKTWSQVFSVQKIFNSVEVTWA